MRRAPLAGAALALTLLVVAGAPGAAGAESPPASASADCVPVQHSKRVTKRVKVRRKGHVVKVKRKKTIRWETCEQQPSAPAATTTPLESLAPCPEPASHLGVTSRDNAPRPRYSLSRACVSAGNVGIQLDNQGEDPHNLLLRPTGSPSTEPTYRLPGTDPFEVPSMAQAEETFALTVGDWYMWCDLQGGLHETQGMYATLAVR